MKQETLTHCTRIEYRPFKARRTAYVPGLMFWNQHRERRQCAEARTHNHHYHQYYQYYQYYHDCHDCHEEHEVTCFLMDYIRAMPALSLWMLFPRIDVLYFFLYMTMNPDLRGLRRMYVRDMPIYWMLNITRYGILYCSVLGWGLVGWCESTSQQVNNRDRRTTSTSTYTNLY